MYHHIKVNKILFLLFLTITDVLATINIATMIPSQSCNMGPDQKDQETRSTNPNISSDILLEEGGKDLRIEMEIWSKMAESEARLHLMTDLLIYKVGFPDVEQFCLDLESKYRATATGSLREKGENSPEWQVVKVCMNLKMIDERKTNSELTTERYNLRKKLEEKHGKNSRKTRNLLKKLRQEASRVKKTVMKKNLEKMNHLKKKF